jgi:hypothetical protein
VHPPDRPWVVVVRPVLVGHAGGDGGCISCCCAPAALTTTSARCPGAVCFVR